MMNKQKNDDQLSLNDFDSKTSPVLDKNVNAFQKPIFRSMWCNPYKPIAQDLSNEFEDTYQEIPPYSKDEKGNWLNDTSVPKLVPTGKINVQERIQSFADDVDIYKILERFAYSGDMSLFNQRPSLDSDIDISNIPDNLNDFNDMFNNMKNNLGSLHPELAKMVLDEKTSFADIELKAQSIYGDRLNKYKDSSNSDNKESEK